MILDHKIEQSSKLGRFLLRKLPNSESTWWPSVTVGGASVEAVTNLLGERPIREYPESTSLLDILVDLEFFNNKAMARDAGFRTPIPEGYSEWPIRDRYLATTRKQFATKVTLYILKNCI